jgi:tetratricopeptide (TPR) repeat protein
MKKNNASEAAPLNGNVWTSREAYLLAMVCLLCGLVMGYLVRGSSPAAPLAVGAATPAQNPAPGSAPLHSAEAVQPLAAPMLAALKADPKNLDALVGLGNLYYDHHVYDQAILFYTRALELKPGDVNVRTDLGTAYWYSGHADNAIAEYEKVLKAQPGFAPALLNRGIVLLEGLKDAGGAIASWEKLLATNPLYPDQARVRSLIAEAKARAK